MQAIIYNDIQADEERISTGAVQVNMTKESLLLDVMPVIEEHWLAGQLPTGDSRCRDKPPSRKFVKKCIDSLRTTFGSDIHFASDNGKWYSPIYVHLCIYLATFTSQLLGFGFGRETLVRVYEFVSNHV